MSHLETILNDLSHTVDWPEPSEHLATRVAGHVESTPHSHRVRRWAIAIAVLTLVIGLVPDTRQAVADLLHEAGVKIGFVEEIPTDLSEDLDLGDPSTMREATEHATFELQAPAALGKAEAVYVDGEAVSMVWEGPTLLTQQTGGEPYALKGVGPDTEATHVTVAGDRGLWIEGAEHTYTLLDRQGTPVEETTRLAANVLLWSSDGVDYRLEITGDLDRALEIATSLESDLHD